MKEVFGIAEDHLTPAELIGKLLTAEVDLLFFGGIELAASTNGEAVPRDERTIMVVTAGVALWNMGVAYVAGLVLYYAAARGIVRL